MVLGCAGTRSPHLDSFIYGAFTKTATFSVANQLGFFTAQNLNVTFSQARSLFLHIPCHSQNVFDQIPNSTFGYATLLAGGFDLLTGTVDNAINLRFNSNQSLSVVGQLDLGPDLVIASVPSITSISQLKGKALMVDAATSGYASVVYHLFVIPAHNTAALQVCVEKAVGVAWSAAWDRFHIPGGWPPSLESYEQFTSYCWILPGRRWYTYTIQPAHPRHLG